ncbi:MAG: site-specific DNA-methyltransferase [Prevotellaceae bacterium]|jgi:site-specific DNA-methyltransferase (adenine-specific)|nr:site-specific DNA-methyltransferase [Prevotellaceae bacterium]
MNWIEPDSIALSFWSPPYFVGKEYEIGETYESWQNMLKAVICLHAKILKSGGFMVINIADIIAFKDKTIPKIQGLNVSNRKSPVTKEMVLEAKTKFPFYNRDQLAAYLGCSEQTIDRRLNGNNIRGGKHQPQTRIKLVGGQLETYAYDSGLYLYDKRIWKKDPAWANSRWTTNTLKAVSETEDLYVFWKAGEYEVNRSRLTEYEWKEWGHRQVWDIQSVRKNDDHEAKFPDELARRVIKLYSDRGDTVLDPFLGSGTTAIAALREGRHYIGIEKEEKYISLASDNIKKYLAQTPLFEETPPIRTIYPRSAIRQVVAKS